MIRVVNEGNVDVETVQLYSDLDSNGSFKGKLKRIKEHKKSTGSEKIIVNKQFNSQTDTEHLAKTTTLEPGESFLITYQAVVESTEAVFLVPAEVHGTSVVGPVSDSDLQTVALTVPSATSTPTPTLSPTPQPSQQPSATPTSAISVIAKNVLGEETVVEYEEIIEPVVTKIYKYIYKQIPLDQDVGGVNESDVPEVEEIEVLVDAGVPVVISVGVGILLIGAVVALKLVDIRRKKKNYTPLPSKIFKK